MYEMEFHCIVNAAHCWGVSEGSAVICWPELTRVLCKCCQNRTSQQQREGDQCPTSVLVSFIGRGRGSLGGLGLGEALWDENWSGLFFLFPLFYLSCHYVSSAVFNDCSSLQAVSGCTAVGGGCQWIFDAIVFKRPETSLTDATNTELPL